MFLLKQEDATEYRLVLAVDSTSFSILLTLGEAIELFEAVNDGIGDYVRERNTARLEFKAGGTPDDDSGYDPSDPKHPHWHATMSGVWDNRPGK